MKLAQIKNAIVYKATLPNTENLLTHMQEKLFTDVPETAFGSAGFAVNEITGEMITPITGGFSFTIRSDEKVIPAKAIKTKVAERIAELQKKGLLDEKINRKEKAGINSMVIAEMCKTAFVKTTLLTCYYNEENHLLFVDTPSANMANMCMHLLVKVTGSVKTETINISDPKHGLTTRLENYLQNDRQPFDGFTVGNMVQLGRKDEQKEVITYSETELFLISDEILDKLSTGFTVEKLRLVFNGDITFVLTNKFHFKQINLLSDPAYEDDDDLPYRWRHEAGLKLFLLSNIVLGLVSVLEYKDDAEKSAACVSKGCECGA
ncbi:recombination-associated protein RdgC [Edwardsiella tarda]|uniref:recombination-associated protein RdgC n=1 Tax=Edwardsiella tarda TaxID=636 RepID=UPI00351C8938